MSTSTYHRAAWDSIAHAFHTMFEGLGEVTEDRDGIRFRTDETGLDIRRDGTSRSFMPLHASSMRWTDATFDMTNDAVMLSDGTSSYLYRVPERLKAIREGGRAA